jgi:hypothetical protein
VTKSAVGRHAEFRQHNKRLGRESTFFNSCIVGIADRGVTTLCRKWAAALGIWFAASLSGCAAGHYPVGFAQKGLVVGDFLGNWRFCPESLLDSTSCLYVPRSSPFPDFIAKRFKRGRRVWQIWPMIDCYAHDKAIGRARFVVVVAAGLELFDSVKDRESAALQLNLKATDDRR